MNHLRVLIVEDRSADAELMVAELRRAGIGFDWHRVDTERDFLIHLDPLPDIILADFQLPQFSGLRALQLAKDRGLDIPFIIVSGSIGEEVAVNAMQQGASDYLLKDRLTRLGAAVNRALEAKYLRDEERKAKEELAMAQNLLHTMVTTVPDYITVKDLESRYVLVNDAYAKFLGRTTPQELVGKTVFDVFPRELAAEYAEADRAVMRTAQPVITTESRTVDRANNVRWHSTARVPLHNGAGQVVGVLNISRDTTAQKEAEEQIQRQLQQLEALRSIDIAITASLDLRVTLNVILDKVTTHLRVDAANVLRFDPYTQSLRFEVNRGFHGPALLTTNLRLGEGHAGRAALERRITSIQNLVTEPGEFARSPRFAGEGFVAYFAVPLIAKGLVKGVLEVFHRAPLAPAPDWLAFLEALAGQAAIAIDNSTLFDNLQQVNTDLVIAYDATMEGWSKALDLRDKETEGHTIRVTDLTLRLARAMDVRDADMVHIRRGALLHDIGKMGIPDQILHKPGPLTDEEWEVMRKHPVYAHELLASIAHLRQALDIPYSHHEKWDGTGYPRGLRGEQIPLAARIFAVMDVYDALTSDRPYRKAWPKDKALTYIREQAGKHFDPDIVEKFLQMEL